MKAIAVFQGKLKGSYVSFKQDDPFSQVVNSHAGDLGNITATKERYSTFHFSTPKISLFEGEPSVIGRSLVIHEDEDDLGKGGFPDSLTTGHTGKRLDCAGIGYDKD